MSEDESTCITWILPRQMFEFFSMHLIVEEVPKPLEFCKTGKILSLHVTLPTSILLCEYVLPIIVFNVVISFEVSISSVEGRLKSKVNTS